MSMQPKQSRFAHMLALLILHAEQLGYEVTLGRGAVTVAANKADGGHPRSTHLRKMAQDLNIFRDGKFLRDGSGHDRLHDYWDSIGGAERITNDLNHYSLLHNGVR